MKIDSHKFATAPRLAERSKPATAAASNTGIVPASKRPSDGFEPVSTRPGTARTGNVGVTGKAGGKTQLNLDFKLDPRLEPHRSLFAAVGAKIANMPEHRHESAIEKSSKRLSKLLNQPLDIVRDGVNEAYRAAAKAPPTLNDPQECAFKSDRILDRSPALRSLESQLKGIGLPFAQDTSLKSRKQILDAVKGQLDQLGLQGRDQKLAERYLFKLVKEARTSPTAQAGAQLPRLNSGTLQLLPRE